MAVEIKNVSKAFGEKKVLRNATITLKDSGIYCLMGPSGMGKTTLLRILMGFETADSGEITGIRPDDITTMFQEDRLLMDLTVTQNVALVYKKRPAHKKLVKDLEQILPRECLNQPVRELSGGMKRRVALARAVHFESRMIVLDEPFTGLDHVTKENVIRYILAHLNGRILLVATHGMDDAELLGAGIIRLDECQDAPEEALPGMEEEQPETEALSVRSDEEIMKELHLFEGIDPEDYAGLIRELGGHVCKYKARSMVWSTGDKREELGILLEGRISAYMIPENGAEQLVQQFGPGESFGEMIPFAARKSPVEVRALSEVRVLFLSVPKLKEEPRDMEAARLKARVWQNLAEEISRKIMMVLMKFELVSEPRTRARIVKYLSSLPENERGEHMMFRQRREVAEYLNVTAPTLSRELAKMKEEGLIDIEGNSIRFLRPPEDWI